MSTNRIQRFIAAGLTVTVGLLLVLAVQVGLTVAATGTPGASSSKALHGKVRIHLKGKQGDVPVGRGRFTISGAISDRGRYVDRETFTRSGLPVAARTLFGAKGTIWIKVGFVKPFPCQCNWRIIKGTKAYAGLRGRGREGGSYNYTVNITMTGTVSQ